jgi:tRNA(fMet)-specific endonuclease VapC
MPPRYMLDTNIVIFIRRERPQAVLERFRVLQPGEAVISMVTYGELLYGAQKSRERLRAETILAEFISMVPVLGMGAESVATAYGAIRADLERRGTVIGGNDLWIAAHALAEKLTLVTNNVGEFARVSGLPVEDWTINSP